MRNITGFKLNRQISLAHTGECYLLGVSDSKIYAEEFYDQSFIAHHEISSDGKILNTIDENFGKNEIIPLHIPDDIIIPHTPLDHPLNHNGLRYQGLREEEKVMEWVQPLAVMTKMPLLKALNLTIPPMMIFGIAESRVLSQTFVDDTTQIVCRRIRLLRALPEIQQDKDGLPYDYDTISFSLLHTYNIETEDYPALHEAIQNRAESQNPQDCLYIGNRLIVSNNSDGDNPNEIHIYDEIDSQE